MSRWKALSDGDGDPNMCLICNKVKMRKTGKTRPGRFFGDLWPDVEMKSSNCGHLEWWGFCF